MANPRSWRGGGARPFSAPGGEATRPAVVLVVVATVLASVPSLAAPAPASYAPWQLLGAAFDSSVKGAWIAQLPGPAPAEVWFQAFDNGGLSRSVQPADGTKIGLLWENVNSGRGLSQSVCGGYSGTFGAGGANTFNCGTQGDKPFLYGSPPAGTSQPAYSDPQDIAAAKSWPSSGLPLASGQPNGLVMRGGAGLSASPDAGRRWYGIPFGCGAGETGHAVAIAIDTQRPGHVVVASGHADTPVLKSASGCDGEESACSMRPIAFAYDAGPLLRKAVDATFDAGDVNKDNAQRKLDEAAAVWGYASVAHLAVSRPSSYCQLWDKVNDIPMLDANNIRLLPSQTCEGSAAQFCHADKPTMADGTKDPAKTASKLRDRWCKDQAPANTCVCADDQANCRYPAGFPGLAIDPRNGFAYLSTDVGLLTSRDGGSRWERVGTCDATSGYPYCDGQPGPAQFEFDDIWPHPFDPNRPKPDGRAARLLTLQGAYMSPPALDDAHATDLNIQPDRIAFVGEVQVTFTACEDIPSYNNQNVSGTYPKTAWENGAGPGAAGAPNRKVGRLVATVPVKWRGAGGVELSSVFMAFHDDCAVLAAGQPAPMPGPLVFRDTGSQITAVGSPLTAASEWKLPQEIDAAHLKLPRHQPIDLGNAVNVQSCCRLMYTSATAAPTDDRMLYAWGSSWADVSLDPACQPNDCRHLTGLWRSLDRGNAWHLAWSLDAYSLHVEGKFDAQNVVHLAASAVEPYAVLVSESGRGGVQGGISVKVQLASATAAGFVTTLTCANLVDCGAGCKTSADNTCNLRLSSCDPNQPIANPCAAVPPGTVLKGCTTSPATGQLRCPANGITAPAPGAKYFLPECLGVTPQAEATADPVAGYPVVSYQSPCVNCQGVAPAEPTACCLTPTNLVSEHGWDPATGGGLCIGSWKRSRGNSGASVQSALIIKPPLGNGMSRYVLAEDDGASATGTLKSGPNSTGVDGTAFTLVQHDLKFRALEAITPDPAAGMGDKAAFAIGNGAGCPLTFAKLVRLSGLDSTGPASVAGVKVFEPLAWGKNSPTNATYCASVCPAENPNGGDCANIPASPSIYLGPASRFANDAMRGLTRMRLVRGPGIKQSNGGEVPSLLASVPGVGVIAVDRATLDLTQNGSLAINKAILPMSDGVNESTAQSPAGPCVSDVLWDGVDTIWATVGHQPDPPAWKNLEKCFPLLPGLYAAKVGPSAGSLAAVGQMKLKLVGSVPGTINPLKDPRTLSIRRTPGGGIQVVVADWLDAKPDGNRCTGGIWTYDPMAQAQGDKWKLAVRMDGVIAMKAFDKGAVTTSTVFAVTDQWMMYSAQLSGGGTPSPKTFAAGVAPFMSYLPHVPGVYQLNWDTVQTVPPPTLACPDPAWTALATTDCYAGSPGCKLVSTVRAFGEMRDAKGVVNAGATFVDVVGRQDSGELVVTTWGGQGAYTLPPWISGLGTGKEYAGGGGSNGIVFTPVLVPELVAPWTIG